jgi:hypothetical protein
VCSVLVFKALFHHHDRCWKKKNFVLTTIDELSELLFHTLVNNMSFLPQFSWVSTFYFVVVVVL